MKILIVELTADAEGTTERAMISVARLTHGTWVAEQEYEMISGMPSAKRHIMIDNEQRIVIASDSGYEVVYDKEQMAAVLAPKDKLAEEQEAQKIESQKKYGEELFEWEENEKKRRAAEAGEPPKTMIGNPVEEPKKEHKKEPAHAATSPMGRATPSQKER